MAGGQGKRSTRSGRATGIPPVGTPHHDLAAPCGRRRSATAIKAGFEDHELAARKSLAVTVPCGVDPRWANPFPGGEVAGRFAGR